MLTLRDLNAPTLPKLSLAINVQLEKDAQPQFATGPCILDWRRWLENLKDYLGFYFEVSPVVLIDQVCCMRIVRKSNQEVLVVALHEKDFPINHGVLYVLEGDTLPSSGEEVVGRARRATTTRLLFGNK